MAVLTVSSQGLLCTCGTRQGRRGENERDQKIERAHSSLSLSYKDTNPTAFQGYQNFVQFNEKVYLNCRGAKPAGLAVTRQ